MTRLSLVLALCLALHAPLFAQTPQDDERRSHFGVSFSMSPTSSMRDTLKILLDADRVDIRSRNLEVGLVVRGRQLGGDWGVSYVQKTFADDSAIDNTFSYCAQTGCFSLGERTALRDVRLRGVAVHKFAPIVTIKRRAQIGLTFGGGVARASGYAERREADLVGSSSTPTETVTQVDARELFLDGRRTLPIWKAEVTAAALVAPGLKVKVGGGIDFTNYPAFSASAVYLIGSRQ